jgi:hypothetical protein
MAMMSLRPGDSVILESKDCTWDKCWFTEFVIPASNLATQMPPWPFVPRGMTDQ